MTALGFNTKAALGPWPTGFNEAVPNFIDVLLAGQLSTFATDTIAALLKFFECFGHRNMTHKSVGPKHRLVGASLREIYDINPTVADELGYRGINDSVGWPP